MTTVPSIHYWRAGDEMNALKMNDLANVIDWMRNPPMVHIGRTLSNQATTASSAENVVSFDTVYNSYDPYDMYDAGDPTKITIQVSGWYDIEYATVLSLDANQGRVINAVRRNAGSNSILSSDEVTAPNLGNLSIKRNGLTFLTAGDYVTLSVIYSTTVARNLLAVSTSECPQLRVRWVSN